MSWADHAKRELREGRIATIKPRGHSMEGRVGDGDTVTIEPAENKIVEVGDVVLARVRGRDYLHLVVAADGKRYLIGNNKGGVNGWTGRAGIYGVVTHVEPK